MIRVRRPFVLAGRVSTSKSWLNRALILRSLHPDLRIVEWEPSELDGEDVMRLATALAALGHGETEFDVGESGTGLRFLLARLSREKGTFKIHGRRSLFERPHNVLIQALANLGTTIQKTNDETFELRATGWPASSIAIEIDSSESSQFASALKLAASSWTHTLDVTLTGPAMTRSAGYLEMTDAMIGRVRAGQRVLVAEPDASSVATLAAVAVAAAHESSRRAKQRLASQTMAEDEIELEKTLFDLRSLVEKTNQPDRHAFRYLEQMRAVAGRDGSGDLSAIEADLGGAPDLFPVLAALAAFAGRPVAGRSKNERVTTRLHGAPHLRFKESDRIREMVRLFKTVGISCRERDDGIEVDGISNEQEEMYAKRRRQGLAYSFDPAQDHRLAFAATVLAAGGIPIEVMHRGVVTKSFPMFWSFVEGDAPRVALIGHRGSGKTEMAKRWVYDLGPRAMMIDLDREIERLAGKSAQEIFETLGEGEFRWFEKRAWREIDKETRHSIGAVIVAIGAGFDPAILDDSWTRVWVRRATDHDGRIFLDRPRLEPNLDALTESLERNRRREPGFAAHHDRALELGEGAESERIRDSAERAWVADLFDSEISGVAAIEHLGGSFTLMPHHNISEAAGRVLRWGVSRIEVRNDLWRPSAEPAAWDFFATLPQEKLLVSFRDLGETAATLRALENWLASNDLSLSGQTLLIDWPLDLEREVPPQILNWVKAKRVQLIASVHGHATVQNLEDAEAKLRDLSNVVMKAALETRDWSDLAKFHDWAEAAGDRRVFLPMTPNSNESSERATRSRWSWYREWLGRDVPHGLNFWREDDGSSLDQPSFSKWWRRHLVGSSRARGRRPTGVSFAAVLGDPVHHSRTPLEHDSFFRDQDCAVFAIPIGRGDVQVALPFLIKLGLKAAAVTAPLKEEIVAGTATNTIAVVGGQIETTSTDDLGFERLWKTTEDLRARLDLKSDFSGEGVVVWGGGGVLPSIRKTLPGAHFYRASTGQPRESGNQVGKDGPEIVIWAAGQTRGAWPAAWKPRLVVDLSYTENSMGRLLAVEVALKSHARYVSGLEMFEAQAEAQRMFWRQKLNPKPDGNPPSNSNDPMETSR